MMIEGYGVKTMTDKQRIAALEAQLAAMTARAEKAESERVEPIKLKEFCRNKCGGWDDDMGCFKGSTRETCEAVNFYEWAINNNHIRG